MTDYLPFENGTILRSEWKKHGYDYLMSRRKHVPMIILADCNRIHVSRVVYGFTLLVDFLTAMGRKPRQGAGSVHELGYYKQGVN